MPNINDRIGSQNVIRVLSNASSPPTKLIELSDVDNTLKTSDGMILVWDLFTNKFIMTSVIDSSTTTINGIVYFNNQENSFLPTNGALVVSGGVGINKNLNVGGNAKISGIVTFLSNLDINASVDILNNLVVNDNFESVGVTTLASSGGITTTGGDFYIHKDFSVLGFSTFLSNLDINASVDILNNLVVNDNFESVGVTTLASSGGITTTGGDLYVGGDLYISDDLQFDEFTARNANVTGISSLNILNVSGVSSFTRISTFNDDVNIIGTLTAGLIDGGEY
jgi:hypothetical protein